MRLRWLIAVLVVLLPLAAMAQRNDFVGRSELVVAGGGMTYIGDLNDQSAFGDVHAAGSIGLRTRLDNRWSVRGMVSYGSISAEKDCIEQRNLSFKSDLFEGAMTLEFDFRPYGPGATESMWTPYLFGGLAVFHFNPMASYTLADGTMQWVELQPLRTEGQGTSLYPKRRPYALTQLSMPFGVGVRLRLGKYVSMTAEYGFRKTWTDYLDDVSTTYVGSELLTEQVSAESAQLADRSWVPNAEGIKRGDDSLDDWYSYFNLSVGVNLDILVGWMRSRRCDIK
ncbi:MAG: outer membrane beta-barrel protein [Bacteroidales bacterium]|nr:outer membrane beta-barrel protein [Bacteroidales bacterium]